MKRRREGQSSTLAFMDVITCGFGAVLLLFILTAKRQISLNQQDAAAAAETAETLAEAIREAEDRNASLKDRLESADAPEDPAKPEPEALKAEREKLRSAIAAQREKLDALKTDESRPEAIGDRERPSAAREHLAGLRLRGPRAVIMLENSGSMLGRDPESALRVIRSGNTGGSAKWKRAKAALRAVLASIPKGTEVAVLHMNEAARTLSGTPGDPFIDPYDNSALLPLLEKIANLGAEGGADLGNGLRAVSGLPERPSSLLYIGDGLPTAPADGRRGALTENQRVNLFNEATRQRPPFPVHILLLPFAGDPSAAGLFWELSARTGGVTLAPEGDWPPPP